MKLIMENWRGYQEKVLLQEGVVDYIKSGFEKLVNMPNKFDQLVQAIKQEFENTYIEKLNILAQSDQMQEIGKDVADKIMQNSDMETLKEEWTSDSSTRQFSLEDLAQMGVGKETIELVAHTVTDTGAEALIKSAENIVGKALPPNIKDWLVRFASKFVGKFVFGFIDNFIMVLAGSFIDTQFAGLSASLVSAANAGLMSAGFGNTVSDAIGELAGQKIEDVLKDMGLDPKDVTDEQVAAGPKWMRFLDKNASVIGIILGCFAGLFPLFFFTLGEEKEKNETII